jgi:hypothetical protein
MADTATVAAISAGGAVLGAGLSGWWSTRSTQRALAAQHAREREVGGEKWLTWKRTVYREFLDAADGLASAEATGPNGREQFEAFWADLRSAYNRIGLAAPDKVRSAAKEFRQSLPEPGKWPPEKAKPWAKPELANALVEAMRVDLFDKFGRQETRPDGDPVHS